MTTTTNTLLIVAAVHTIAARSTDPLMRTYGAIRMHLSRVLPDDIDCDPDEIADAIACAIIDADNADDLQAARDAAEIHVDREIAAAIAAAMLTADLLREAYEDRVVRAWREMSR